MAKKQTAAAAKLAKAKATAKAKEARKARAQAEARVAKLTGKDKEAKVQSNLREAFSATTPTKRKPDTEDTAPEHQEPNDDGTDDNAGFVTPETKKGSHPGHLGEGLEENTKIPATEDEEEFAHLQEPTADTEHAPIDPKDMEAKSFAKIVLENMPKDNEPELEWSIRRNTNTFNFLREVIDADEETVQLGQKFITRVKIMVRTEETPAKGSTAMGDLNEMLNSVISWAKQKENNALIGLMPWNCTKHVSTLFLQSLTCTQDAVAYLYGFRPLSSKGGRNYLRMSISTETPQKAENFIKAVNQMGDFNTVSCSRAPSAALNPETVGWFLRSGKDQCDANSMDMHKVIKRLCNIKGPFGLYWTNVKSNLPYDKNRKQIKAMHLEVESAEADKVTAALQSFCNQDRGKILGTALLFVPRYEKANLTTWQETHYMSQFSAHKGYEDIIRAVHWTGRLKLENSTGLPGALTLREWLTQFRSIFVRKGQDQGDLLFTSITASTCGMITTFMCTKNNLQEATSVVKALPLIIEEDLNVQASTFMATSSIASAKLGQWNPKVRLFVDKDELSTKDFVAQTNALIKNANSKTAPLTKAQEKELKEINGDEVSADTRLTNKAPIPIKKRRKMSSSSSQSTASSLTDGTSPSKTKVAVSAALTSMAADHKYDLDKKDDEARILAEKNAHLSQMIENLLAKKSKGLDITENELDAEVEKEAHSVDMSSAGSGKRKADSLENESGGDSQSEHIGSNDSDRSPDDSDSSSDSSSSEDSTSDQEMESLTANETSKIDHTLDSISEDTHMEPAAGTDNAGEDG